MDSTDFYLTETPKETPLQDLIAGAKKKYDRPALTQHEKNMAGMREFLQMKAFKVYRPRTPPTHLAELPRTRMAWWKTRKTDRQRCGTPVEAV